MRWNLVLFFLIALSSAPVAAGDFQNKDCAEFKTNEGAGVLKYCDNGKDQMLYLKGDLDDEEDPKDTARVAQIIDLFGDKVRKTGKFRVVTVDSGGGTTELFQNLMRSVELNCRNDCVIQTEINGQCQSACNQMHFTCVKNARTIANPGSNVCDHASTGDPPECKRRDINPPYKSDLCEVSDTLNEYLDRCNKFVEGRGLEIDEQRRSEVDKHFKGLADGKVFDTSKFTCNIKLPWADSTGDSQPAAPVPLPRARTRGRH